LPEVGLSEIVKSELPSGSRASDYEDCCCLPRHFTV